MAGFVSLALSVSVNLFVNVFKATVQGGKSLQALRELVKGFYRCLLGV